MGRDSNAFISFVLRFWDRALCSPWSEYVAKASFELLILVPLSPLCLGLQVHATRPGAHPLKSSPESKQIIVNWMWQGMPQSLEVETRKSAVQGHFLLLREPEIYLCYMRPWVKQLKSNVVKVATKWPIILTSTYFSNKYLLSPFLPDSEMLTLYKYWGDGRQMDGMT